MDATPSGDLRALAIRQLTEQFGEPRRGQDSHQWKIIVRGLVGTLTLFSDDPTAIDGWLYREGGVPERVVLAQPSDIEGLIKRCLTSGIGRST